MVKKQNDISQNNGASTNSRYLLNYIIEHTRSAVAVHDRNLHYIYVSKRYLQEYNVKVKNVIGKHHYEIFPDLPQKWRDVHQRAMAGEILSAEDDPYVREDGTVDWTRWECRPWYEQNGSIGGIIIYTEVITERKRIEQKLRESEEKHRTLFNTMTQGVVYQNANGQITSANPAAEQILGLTLEQMKGLTSIDPRWKAIHEDGSDFSGEEHPIQVALRTNKEVFGVVQGIYHSASNSYVWIKVNAVPLFRPGESRPYQAYATFEDITASKRTEEALQKTQKLESLGVLAGGIAHDFNNLLGGIYGYIDMALESSNNENVSGYLSKTISTIERARVLTKQLLTFAKGGAPVQKIAPLFPSVQETAQFALSGSNVSCGFTIQQGLWNCNYDKNQVSQVIDNLIINAQQAMPIGGNITVSAHNISLAEKEHPLLAKGNYVRISIKDSGIGIPKELLTRIFDPFFTSKTKGHGLGLATCYSIINRHDGCIDVYSEPGKGSVFHVYLPAAKESIPDAENVFVKLHKGNGTILVMDDEEVIRETISSMLSSLGYTVVCRENGKDAVDYVVSDLKANRVLSGMIFDLTVPGGMGGKDAVAQIRKLNTVIPVFVASGYADDPVMKNPAGYGFTASICKPFRQIELIEMLGKHIDIGC